jgi:protein-disulfide isomerase
MSKLALYACIVAAAACTKHESRLDGVSGTSPTTGTAAPGAAPRGAGTTEDRLSRVERRLDKVIALLEENLPPAPPARGTVFSVPISPTDPVEGPADAKVTIVEAFEFLCPACYMATPTVDQILEKYPNDVRVVGKYVVIHRQPAVWAAQVGCAAHKQGKYTAVKNALWKGLFKMEGDRPAMQNENANLDAMKKLAVDAGADPARLEADLPGCMAWIQDSARTLTPLGVNSTPSFFVNGRFIQSFDIAEFDALIKEEIAKADKAIADGVPQAQYYQREIVAKGEKKAKGRFDD